MGLNGRRTLMGSSPGKYTLVWSHIDGGAVRLWNFDIDKHTVKDEHRTGLDLLILPFLKKGGSARVVGLTSRTGSYEHNKRLSERRAAEVVHALEELLGTKPRVLGTAGEGEIIAESAGARMEDSYWRAVTVFWWQRPDPPTSPVRRYMTKSVHLPAAKPIVSSDGAGAAAGGEAIARTMLAGNSVGSVIEGDSILVPLGFEVTRIEIRKESVRVGQPKSVSDEINIAVDKTVGGHREVLVYRFWWGPPRSGSVEVWTTEAFPRGPDGSLLLPDGRLLLQEWATRSRAMWIYEHPDVHNFRPREGPK
jgi:hypothetical protein